MDVCWGRMNVTGIALLTALGLATGAWAQEGVFLTEQQATAAVFPGADGARRDVVAVSPEMRRQMQAELGEVVPSIWESEYVTYTATQGAIVLGYAVIVEEIGKHRPITFVVGVRTDGKIGDVAVMAYREAIGGDVRRKRFLTQYRSKSAGDDLQPNDGIKNIAGATLSVEAASRAVRKALAFARVALGTGGA